MGLIVEKDSILLATTLTMTYAAAFGYGERRPFSRFFVQRYEQAAVTMQRAGRSWDHDALISRFKPGHLALVLISESVRPKDDHEQYRGQHERQGEAHESDHGYTKERYLGTTGGEGTQ